MTSALLAAVFAATQVYRLELTDETPYIVGQDGERREVCIIEPEQYALLTGRVETVWQILNSSREGRRSLHGSQVRTEIDTTNMTKTVVYSDGFRFSERFAPPRTAKGSVKVKRETASLPRIFSGSARRIEFLKAMEARQKVTTKEVTVEHDAATGKDEVK